MRNAFATALCDAADKDESLRLLVGDIGFRVFDEFISKHPNRFINCGIAEQNMISVAAGMASEGLRPVVYTIIPFLVMRAFEQIRVDIGINQTNVMLVGVGAGFAYDKLGPTHHAYEDIALMRTVCGLQLYVPFDPKSTEQCFRHAHTQQLKGIGSYIRLSKGGEAYIPTTAVISDHISIARMRASDKCIVVHGAITATVLDICEEKDTLHTVLSITLINDQIIDRLICEIGARITNRAEIIVVEECFRFGSLYSEIAMRVAENGLGWSVSGIHIPHMYTFDIQDRNYLINQKMKLQERIK